MSRVNNQMEHLCTLIEAANAYARRIEDEHGRPMRYLAEVQADLTRAEAVLREWRGVPSDSEHRGTTVNFHPNRLKPR